MLSKSDKIILDTLLPANAHPLLPQGLAETGFEAFWRDQRGQMAPGLRLAFRAALLVANWASPMLVRRLPPLTRYRRPIREQALHAMSVSRFFLLRGLLRALKLGASLCYGTNRQVRDAIGFSRPQQALETEK